MQTTTTPPPSNATLGLMAAGLVSNVAGSFYSAKLNKINLEGQAALADINARIAELGARQEMIRGDWEIGQVTRHAGKVKSAQRVALAANGVDLGEGSAAEIQASTDLLKELDVNTIKANAVRSAWGYRTQGLNYQAQATMGRAAAEGINPMASAAGSFITSAGQVASNWYMLNKSGAFDKPSTGPIGGAEP